MKIEKNPVNKHGLARRIPSEIKKQIRKDDGYGCVICGNILVDYEHIDPLFCDATEHDPEKMALLCSTHHDQVTRKVLPKRIIKEHKKNPYCKSRGYAHSNYYPNPEDVKIKLGNSYLENTKIILAIDEKPIIWIDSEEGSPILFNAIFYDHEGNKLGFLNKNTFIALVTECDISGIGSRIEARLKRGKINLTINLEGDQVVEIKRLNTNYAGNNVEIDNEGSLTITTGTNSFKIGSLTTRNCGTGIRIGSIPTIPTPIMKLKKLDKEILRNKLKAVKGFNGNYKGYIINNRILNLKGECTGYLQDSSVYNVKGEYIGKILLVYKESAYWIVMDKDEYKDREPIYIQSYDKTFNKISAEPLIDMSYRILE